MLVRTLALVLATAGLLVPTAAPAIATPDNYTPRSGPTFNSPLGTKRSQQAIFRKIIRSINSTPRGHEINMFTWNFLTREGKEALLRAQRRGVRVRLIMDDINNEQFDNTPFRRLRAGLRRGNQGRPADRRSWARLCQGTCRGGGGAAHSKFFMFSKAGKARQVVIQGSANLTVASTSNQWNDIYTHRGNRKVWAFANRTFTEAARDRRARKIYMRRSFGRFDLIMFPNVGNVPDPVMQMLNRTKCRRATNTRSGRTRIRIAPDVVRNARGMRLARKVDDLWNRGCDIKLGYTVMGIDIGRMLRANDGRRGPVPMKHLVQDFDGDGQFDNYFHMKSMTIVGNYGKDRSNHVLLNGSANWSGLGGISDENLGVYRQRRWVRRYENHINYWYDNFPNSARSRTTARGTATTTGGGDRLVFGSGPDAVYENGERVSTDGTDPFAKIFTD
jgi:hypothetical protein